MESDEIDHTALSVMFVRFDIPPMTPSFPSHNDAAFVIDLHQAKLLGAVGAVGDAADGDVGVHVAVVIDELHVVHAVQVIPRQYHDILDDPVLDIAEQPSILPDSVGSALEPGAVCGSLGGGKDLDESLAAKADTGAHVVGASQVAVQRGRIELGEDVDLADAAVDAVALKRRYDDE